MTATTMTASPSNRMLGGALATGLLLAFLLLFSCGGDDNTNDGSSVKPAQDAAGDEYDRRRGGR